MAVFKDKKKTKDGRSWYYSTYKKDFKGNNVLYKSKRYLTKKDAEEAERLFLTKRDNPTKKNFHIVALAFLEKYNLEQRESSYETAKGSYFKHIMPYFEDFDINSINVQEINKWREMMLKKGYSTRYLNKIQNIFKKIFDFAMINYGVSSNPVQIVGRFKTSDDEVIKDNEKIKYITLEDFNTFIDSIDDELWHTFFTFLFYTGCRKGEVLALTWEDIDFNKNEISINKTLYYKHKSGNTTKTKNSINRIIKMNTLLSSELAKHKKEMMHYSDFSEKWFVFGNTKFLAPVTIDRYKEFYFKKSGLDESKYITIHQFRHSHVTLLINEYIKQAEKNNTPIDTKRFFIMMSNRMGHTVEVMEKTYLHLFPTVQDEIVNLLENFR